jgi:hypothetical protein
LDEEKNWKIERLEGWGWKVIRLKSWKVVGELKNWKIGKLRTITVRLSGVEARGIENCGWKVEGCWRI